MKQLVILALTGIIASNGYAQGTSNSKFQATPEQVTVHAADLKNNMLFQPAEGNMLEARPNLPAPSLSSHGKVAAVSPVAIGTASDVFTAIRTEQNQVAVNNDLNMVVFTHEHNRTIFGGSLGYLRYDISIDGGTTFSNDIGVLNPAFTMPARFPNGAIVNPAGNTNPVNAYLSAYSSTYIFPTYDGHLAGVSRIVTSGAPSLTTENYLFLAMSTRFPSGLCHGLPQEYWVADVDFDGSSVLDTIRPIKGVWNSGTSDIDWDRSGAIFIDPYTGYDGSVRFVGPNIAFSPDGSVGWIAFLGDIDGDGVDSTYQPCFSKTTDNGVTWSTPVAMNLNSVAWVADSLKSLWVDGFGNPVSTGRAGCAYDFDLTVDADGNPHMSVVIGSASSTASPFPNYLILPGLAKFLADVHSTDGGLTWDVDYISPILTFRTQTFGSTSTTVYMDNYPQISRSEDGRIVFYSWVDSDTAQFTGNMIGLGFGEYDNLKPNLRIAAKNVTDGSQTYPQLVTDGDFVWDGIGLFPTMAPVVLNKGADCWNLPIVVARMPWFEPIDPTEFYYFGNDASICATDFCDPGGMTLGWPAFGYTGATPPCLVGVEGDIESVLSLGNPYPNPTSYLTAIPFTLPTSVAVKVEITDIYGQTVAVLADGDFSAGNHRIDFTTDKLPAGLYLCNFHAEGQILTKKIIVTK